MAWYNSSWLYRKKVTIDAASVDGSLTNFPVYVGLGDADIQGAARADLRDVVFTSADGTTKLSHELVKRHSLMRGAWTWFNDPRALFHEGTQKRTYFGGVEGQTSNVVIGQVDHKTGIVTNVTLRASLEEDDHDNPGLLLRPSDSKLVAFYSKHNAENTHYWKVASNAESIASWGSEQSSTDTGYTLTYANPYIIDGDSNACYLFYRRKKTADGTWYWAYKRTTDYSSFGSPVDIWYVAGLSYGSYLKIRKNGANRLDFLAADGNPSWDTNRSVYHFYCEWSGGALHWYKSDGTEITSGLPLTPADVTKIYDGSTYNSWIWDISIDGSGYPRALMLREHATDDLRCMYSRWNGSAWTTAVEITAFGSRMYSTEPHYAGGACFDQADINKVYIGKQVSGIYEMQEWATTDDGATWAKTQDITSGSSSGFFNVRPYSPEGHDGTCAMLYWSGPYVSAQDYNAYISAWPPLATEAYVKVPSVSDSVDTEIYVYYGNASASTQEDPTNVWDSDYLAVYHLNDTPGNTNIYDSTANARTATKHASYQPKEVLNGEYFTKASAVENVQTPATINLAGKTQWTLESVINHDGSGASGAEHTIWSNWEDSPNQACAMVRIEPSAGSVSNGLEIFAIRQTDTQIGGDCGLTVTPNQINYVAAVYDATSLRGHVNATESTTTFSTSGAAMDAGASQYGRIGGHTHTSGNDWFGGYIYEVRISQVARSVAWRKATNTNIRTPASFYTLGTEEIDAGGTISGTGNLSSTLAFLSGAGKLTHSGTGTVTTNSTLASGNGKLSHISSGSLTAILVTLSASGVLTHTSIGDLVISSITVSGTGTISGGSSGVSGSGTLLSSITSLTGSGKLSHIGIGSILSSSVQVTATGILVHKGTGNLVPVQITISGSGKLTHTGSGSITITVTTLSGSANSGTLSLTQADIDAIVSAIFSDPRLLTLPKWLALR